MREARRGAGLCSSGITTHKATSTGVTANLEPPASPSKSCARLISPAEMKFVCVPARAKLASSLHITSGISSSKEGVRVQREGCGNSHGGFAFINCYSRHPLYQLFWTHAFPTQAHARHPRADNLPRQVANTSHLLLPPRIMCFPVSPAM